GEGVVQFDHPGAAPDYVVIEGGARYTTNNPSPEVKARAVAVEPKSETAERVQIRLREVAHNIKELSASVYSQWGVDAVLESIESFRAPDKGKPIQESVRMQLLAETLSQQSGLSQSDDKARSWAELAYNRLRNAFTQLRLPGDTAREALGTLGFFSLHPNPA